MQIDLLLNPVNLRRLTIALVLAVCIAAPARDQSSPLPAAALMNKVVANELTDRVQQRKWMYVIDKREGKQTLTEEQVETKDGPLYRLLAIDGTPLSLDQRQQDNARMDRFLHDSSQQLKFKRGHYEDEQKLQKLMSILTASLSLRLRRRRGRSCQAQISPQLQLQSPDLRSSGSA